MKLQQAIKSSEYKAAIHLSPTHSWHYIVVAKFIDDSFGYRVQYTTEIHQYDRDGNLLFITANFSYMSLQRLKLQLGDFLYNSEEWEAYGEPMSMEQSLPERRQKVFENIKKVKNRKRQRTLTKIELLKRLAGD